MWGGGWGGSNRGGGGGWGGSKRGIMSGAVRASIQIGRALGGAVITSGALIQGANEIGEAMNRGRIGTEAATGVAKALGFYKEDLPKNLKPCPNPLQEGGSVGRGG